LEKSDPASYYPAGECVHSLRGPASWSGRESCVARHGVSIALACRTFGMSETCYRYSPLLSDENEEIADLLVGLTIA
jgi:hypothetical protein